MTRALTILVAEDSPTSRQILIDYIRLLGHTAVAVCNGQEAVDYCIQQRPDVIFMDVTMPVMDGFAATSAIRQLLGEHWIPIIFLTSLSDRSQLLRGLTMGADDYLPSRLTWISSPPSCMC
jgi:CheY-like chemotaxis protein